MAREWTRHRRLALLGTMVLAFGVAAGAVPANAQPVSFVTIAAVDPSDPAPTHHAYATEFLRQRSGCRNRVIPVIHADLQADKYGLFFEFRSGTGHSVLIWNTTVTDRDFGRLTYETSGVGSLAAIVQRVCDFLKTRQNQP